MCTEDFPISLAPIACACCLARRNIPRPMHPFLVDLHPLSHRGVRLTAGGPATARCSAWPDCRDAASSRRSRYRFQQLWSTHPTLVSKAVAMVARLTEAKGEACCD